MKFFYDKKVLLLIGILILLVIANLYVGVEEEQASLILQEIRWPRTLTALFAGSILSISGLLLQTLFKNPLAGPDLLGIQNGAALGINFWYVLAPLASTHHLLFSTLGPMGMATLGAILATVVIMLLALRLKSPTALLLGGVVFSSFTISVQGLLIPILEAQGIRSFMIWSLGSFERVSKEMIAPYLIMAVICVIIAWGFSWSLNIFFAGPEFSKSLWGEKKEKFFIISIVFISAICSAIATMACGPIALIGLVAPHIARWVSKRGNHFRLIPLSVMTGMIIALGLQFLMIIIPLGSLTINSMAGILGTPIIFYLLFRGKELGV